MDDLLNERAYLADIVGTIRAASRNGPATAVLRHSIRGEVHDILTSDRVLLTPEGKELAFALGAALPTDRLLALRHSPIPRCRETAEEIGCGFASAGGRFELLGASDFLCGFFMHDQRAGVRLMDAHGIEGFMAGWIEGRLDPRVIMPAPDAAARLLAFLLGSEGPGDGARIDLHVTHDVIVILLMGLLVDTARVPYAWPGYLEGMVLGATGPGRARAIHFRGRERPL